MSTPPQPAPKESDNSFEHVLSIARKAHVAKDRVMHDLSDERREHSLSERERLIVEEERHRRTVKAEASGFKLDDSEPA